MMWRCGDVEMFLSSPPNPLSTRRGGVPPLLLNGGRGFYFSPVFLISRTF
jgi:hypothetical protein